MGIFSFFKKVAKITLGVVGAVTGVGVIAKNLLPHGGVPPLLGGPSLIGGSWKKIGYEFLPFQIPAGSHSVRWGAENSWLVSQLSGPKTYIATNALFGGDPAQHIKKSVEIYIPPPSPTVAPEPVITTIPGAEAGLSKNMIYVLVGGIILFILLRR